MQVEEITDFAERILFSSDLAQKLTSPERFVATKIIAPLRHIPDGPSRAPEQAFSHERGKHSFPATAKLDHPVAQGAVLHFFANHELLALELMALVLLRFPEAPEWYRVGLAYTMREEQQHLNAYIGAMQQRGVAFGSLPLNNFFWRSLAYAKTLDQFVVGMHLTLEQANLDFSERYRQLFAEAGATDLADMMAAVLRDEIKHVAHGVKWAKGQLQVGQDLWSYFTDHLHMPLSTSRAKGSFFCVGPREAAGLDAEFITRLRLAGGSKGRPPTVFWYNVDVEAQLLHLAKQGGSLNRAISWTAPELMRRLMHDFAMLPAFYAQTSDVVSVPKEPSLAHQDNLQRHGFSLPEWHEAKDPFDTVKTLLRERAIDSLQPWGMGPDVWTLWQKLNAAQKGRIAKAPLVDAPHLLKLFDKREALALRERLRAECSDAGDLFGDPWCDGILLRKADVSKLAAIRQEIAAKLGLGIVIKAPYSAAGQQRILVAADAALTATQESWLQQQLDLFDALILEPRLPLVLEGSLVAESVRGEARITEFFCDRRGQYAGHYLHAFMGNWSQELRQFWHQPDGYRAAVAEYLPVVQKTVVAWLERLEYQGPYGIDWFIFRKPDGQFALRLLSEVNVRWTMGHIAARLMRRVAHGQPGMWFAWRREQCTSAGFASFQAFANWAEEKFPPVFKAQTRGLIQSALLSLNDPAAATDALSLMAVGEEAMRWVANNLSNPGPTIGFGSRGKN